MPTRRSFSFVSRFRLPSCGVFADTVADQGVCAGAPSLVPERCWIPYPDPQLPVFQPPADRTAQRFGTRLQLRTPSYQPL